MILSRALSSVLTHRRGPVLWGTLEGRPVDVSGAVPVQLSFSETKPQSSRQYGTGTNTEI